MHDIHSKLLTYAYNIVGSYEDAKDLVQDVIEKHLQLDKTHVRNDYNYLVKSTINHAINFKNKHGKKEVFGTWLPEPISFDNPETTLIKEQTASYTMLVLLENLNPKERAVFILKEGFGYSHLDIAALLDISSENSRQLLSRSHKELKNRAYIPDPGNTSIHADTLLKYQKALSAANIKDIEDLLVNDIMLMADGGNTVKVIQATEVGKKATATLLSHVQQQFLKNKTHSFHTFNHQPAICFWKERALYNCQILQIDAGSIRRIYSIVDPLKLKNILKLSRF